MPKTIFTPEIFAEISNLVAQGFDTAEIAAKIGCTMGSLRVRCSQKGVRLRLPKSKPVAKSKPRERLTLRLSENIALRLEQQAHKRGKTRKEFAIALLEAIVRDNLYDAVLDQDVVGRWAASMNGRS
jgi:hypothetical protein